MISKYRQTVNLRQGKSLCDDCAVAPAKCGIKHNRRYHTVTVCLAHTVKEKK